MPDDEAKATLDSCENLQRLRRIPGLIVLDDPAYIGCACRPSVLPSGPDRLALLPGSRNACPSEESSAHGRLRTQPCLCDRDHELGTAEPSRRSAPERRDTRDLGKDPRCRQITRLRVDCQEQPPASNHPTAEKPSRAAQPTPVYLIGATGVLLRSINKSWQNLGAGFSPEVIWGVVKQKARSCEIPSLAPHDLRRSCPRLCHQAARQQIQFLLGQVSIQTTETIFGLQTALPQRGQ
jgi:hypothetical protein